jgi:peptide/nickel transport system substrate-binding protein
VALAASAAASSAPAVGAQQAGQNCVKIGGIESSEETLSLDPVVQPSSENAFIIDSTYNRLTDEDDSFNVKPELADSWEPNADGSQWTFHLHHGVKFTDGKDLTAADVVYTYKRLLDPATGAGGVTNQLSFLKDIAAPDPYTIVFKAGGPVAELPSLITNKAAYIIENGSTKDQLTLHGVGTGPFIPVNFTPGQQPHRFVKNPNYWEAGLPKADCLEMYVIQEPTTRNAALQSGQIDVAQSVDYATIPAIQSDPNIQLISTAASTSLMMAMQTDVAPLNDNRVRQALKKVVDRQQMVDTVLSGYGTVGDDNPVPPTSPFAWRKDVPGPDVEGAKQLLADAGFGPDNPLQLDLYIAEYLPGATNMALLFKDQAAQAGVEVNVITSPASEYWDNVADKHPFFGTGWSARPPGQALAVDYRTQPPDTPNDAHWNRADFDALLDQAATTVDPAGRADLYKRAEQLVAQEGGVVTPMFVYTVAGVRSNCTGYQPRVQIVRADFRTVSCTR